METENSDFQPKKNIIALTKASSENVLAAKPVKVNALALKYAPKLKIMTFKYQTMNLTNFLQEISTLRLGLLARQV